MRSASLFQPVKDGACGSSSLCSTGIIWGKLCLNEIHMGIGYGKTESETRLNEKNPPRYCKNFKFQIRIAEGLRIYAAGL